MTEPDLKNETTENLLEYIKWKEEPEYLENSKQAFRIFTFRYQLDLHKKLIRICINWGYDEQVASEIAYRTFDKVWKYPKFDISKANQTDINKAVLYYLYRIASRLLADYNLHRLMGTKKLFVISLM